MGTEDIAAVQRDGTSRDLSIEERWFFAVLARDLVAHLVTRATAWNELAQTQGVHLFDFVGERTSHRGTPSRRIDHLMEQAAKRWLENSEVLRKRTFLLYGEESTSTSDLEFEKPILVQADAIDGTTNMAIVQRDWSVVVLTHMWSQGHDRYIPCGGAIGLADLQIVWWHDITRAPNGEIQPLAGNVSTRRIHVPVGFPGEGDLHGTMTDVQQSEDHSIPDPLPNPVDPESVAMVAAASVRRRTRVLQEFSDLMRAASYFTLTAGTPLLMGALRGQLGAIIESEWTSIHDSAHLIPLMMVGWKVDALEDQAPLALSEILWENLYPGSPDRPVPPYLAYRSKESRSFVLEHWSPRGATS